MKPTFFLAALFLFFLLRGHAQHTVLWSVTDTGSKHVSYLLGTYHLAGSSFVDSFPVITEKLRLSDLVVTESLLDVEEIRRYYESRRASDTLSKILSPEDIQLLRSVLNNKVDVFKLTPGELYAFLMTSYEGYVCLPRKKDSLRIDGYVQHLATVNNKQQLYLEKKQIEMVTQLTGSYSWAFFKRNGPKLLNKYRKGSPDGSVCTPSKRYLSLNLDYSFRQRCTQSMETRNSSWIQQLAPLLTRKSCFIAVGYAHLFYTCGLVQQLRQQGFVVEEIRMQ
jgi:uncharacterized protein YbaP (TraB family)